VTDVDDLAWDIWAEWEASGELTLTAGAERIAACLRLVHALFPAETATFTIGSSAKNVVAVDDPALAERLVPRLKASRNKNIFGKDDDRFGDASILLFPTGPFGLSVHAEQVGIGATGRFELHTQGEYAALLATNPDAVATLVGDLAGALDARNAWVDMAHVRQEWNQWSGENPVYGWATWLRPAFATVDTVGLDVDTRPAGDGTLITLRADPVAMARGEAGRDAIRQLARRTVFADGRLLIDVNARLREATDDGDGPAEDAVDETALLEPVETVRGFLADPDDPVATVEHLLAAPFPQDVVIYEDAEGRRAKSGPTHHIAVLAIGKPDLIAQTDQLIAALTQRWGPPTELDLVPAMRVGVPLAVALVDDYGVTRASSWTRDGRTVVVAWSQIDADEPVEIVAGVELLTA